MNKKPVDSLSPQGWPNSAHVQGRDLNANELTSISALIAFIAHNSGEPEFRVERRLADKFNVANVTRLSAANYDDAVRFLVDSNEAIRKI